jgi:hypothetical protein
MMEDGKWNMLQHNIKTLSKRFVENETNGSAVSVDAKIREIYDHYNPKL